MKKTYLCVVLFAIWASINAQPTITSLNLFSAGDHIVYQNANGAATFSQGNSGAAVTWDFSGLSADGTEYTIDYLNPTTTDWGNHFQTSDMSEKLNNDTVGYMYFSTSNGDLSRMGFSNNSAMGTEFMVYNQPLVLLDFPFTYLSNATSTYSGIGEYGYGPESPLKVEGGNYSFNADAYGTLKLPGKTYNNALRVHVTESFHYNYYMDAGGSPMFIIGANINDDCYYWFVEGVKGSVLQYVASTTDAGSGPSTSKRLSFIKENGSTVFDWVDGSQNLAVYPNPANGYIKIENNKNQKIEIEVYDLIGNIIFKTQSFEKTTVIDLAKYNKGVYFVKISSAYSTVTKKIQLID